ncbi:MAG TPA: serine/threonine-protein kinase [Gemmatales bacterium]|nr:serine/threonine-protein kinase [Gemmatales bacterium]HMP59245.1 serine/threonine-protein kinase [Gemmatales bacterium]
MEGYDPILYKVLTSHPLLGDGDARAAFQWWNSERWTDETLVDFMVRVRVFVPDSEKTINMMRKGAITYCDPKRIFGDFGHQRLREFSLRNNFVSRPEFQMNATPPPGAPSPTDSGTNLQNLNKVREWLAEQAAAKQVKQSQPAIQAPPPPTPSGSGVIRPQQNPAGPPSSGYRVLGRAPSGPPPSGSSGIRPALPKQASVPTGPRPLEPGEQVGKYLLIEQIGSGGTSLVFRALHRVLNIPVAIKVLKLEQGDALSDIDQQVYEQLRKEAQLLARFNHPNIVRVYDFEEEAAYPFLVMEFVDGLSLSEMISHAGRIRADRAVKIGLQVAEGLGSAQRKTGLVHRDVKPGNILLARDGSIKLADLGLAMTHACRRREGGVEASMVLAGTVAYMSPEQAQGTGEVDQRSDIYSLGATLYHAITGDMPFKGKNRMEMMFKHATEVAPLPHQLVPGLDPAFSDILMRMLAKNPAERFQGYEELAAALTTLTSKSDSMIAVPSTVSTPMATLPTK